MRGMAKTESYQCVLSRSQLPPSVENCFPAKNLRRLADENCVSRNRSPSMQFPLRQSSGNCFRFKTSIILTFSEPEVVKVHF